MQGAKHIFNCRNLSFWLMQKVFSSHYSIVFQQGFHVIILEHIFLYWIVQRRLDRYVGMSMRTQS